MCVNNRVFYISYNFFLFPKVTRKIRSKLVTEHVNKAVAQRKKWTKFGEEEGRKAGPDLSTTTIGENIPLKLKSNTGKVTTTAQSNIFFFR